MRSFWQDLRFGVRSLVRSPGFSVVAILALALGIAANTTIFSVVNAVLLRDLPYRDAGRLVMLYEELPALMSGPVGFSPPDYDVFEQQVRQGNLASLSEIALYLNSQLELSGIGEPQRLAGGRISPALFPILGVAPAMGRNFTSEENAPGQNVVILSHGLWQRKFGSASDIVGRSVTLDRKPYTVVGVMPRGFEFPHRGTLLNNQPAELWVPISFTSVELQGWTQRYNHSVLARLKPGVNIEQARAETGALAGRLVKEFYPPAIRNSLDLALKARVEPYRGEMVGKVQTLLLVLLGAVGMVLLIGCADVANLMLTRAAARQREMAIRTALGAGRGRLLRQVLTESLTLALCGGALGVVLSAWGTRLLVAVAPVTLPRAETIGVDARVLAFALALSIATALFFGLAPALEASRGALAETLQEGGRSSTAGRRRHRLLNSFVVAQFSLAIVLLAGAGLLARSFMQLLSTDPGFRPDHLLSASLNLPVATYPQQEHVRDFCDRLLERARAVPGVVAATAASFLPLEVRERRAFSVDGSTPDGIPPVTAAVWFVGDYFESLGNPLKRGRFPTASDGRTGERVAVINETMANKFFPGRDPVGQRIKWGGRRSQNPWMTIIGVAGDMKHANLDAPAYPLIFEPGVQMPIMRNVYLIVRTSGEPATLATALRQEIRRLDSALAIANVRTLEDHIARTVAPQRFQTFLLATFAGLALLLAAIGIYGVLAYTVTQRTHEIGVRMALGAQRRDVLRMIVGRGMRLAAVGIALGFAASLALTRVLATLLYGIGPRDPLTLTVVPAFLAAIALLACYIPARRAMRLDPAIALRHE
ncbi:MAG: ABC transporter permease [Bryobacteraceae bacterium]